MKLLDFLLREVLADKALLQVDDDAAMAVMEALGLYDKLSLEDDRSKAYTGLAKKAQGPWKKPRELYEYLELVLADDERQPHRWKERIAALAPRLPKPTHGLVIALLAYVSYRDGKATIEDYILSELAQKLGVSDIEPFVQRGIRGRQQVLDYDAAVEAFIGRWKLEELPQEATAEAAVELRARLVDALRKAGMGLPRLRDIPAEELATMPEHTLLMYFEDAAPAVQIYEIPASEIDGPMQRALSGVAGASFSDPSSFTSSAEVGDAVRVVAALDAGIDKETLEAWRARAAASASDADRERVPSAAELDASFATLSKHFTFTFEPTIDEPDRQAKAEVLNKRFTRLVAIRHTM